MTTDALLRDKTLAQINLGSTGLRQTGGFVSEDFLTALRGVRAVRFYEEMSKNNSVIATIRRIVDLIVRQVSWHVETQPGMEDIPAALEQKEFLESCLEDMEHTWEDFISESLSMLDFGWAYFEKVFKLRKGMTQDPKTNSFFDDGKWGWRKLEIRSQDSLWQWKFDEDGALVGMVQLDTYRANKGPVLIPLAKAVHFVTRSFKNNPEGEAFLRGCVRDYNFVKRIQEYEAIGIERDLTGMPIMEVPLEVLVQDATPEMLKLRSMLETMIQQIRVDERWGGLIPTELDSEAKPTGFKFRLATTGGTRMINTNDIVKRYESRMAMVYLAEFIMIGMDRVGTQGADQSKKDLFKTAIETILTDMIAARFNRTAVSQLMLMNGVPRELHPIIVPGRVSSPELDKLGAFVNSLATSGILSPNKALENKLLGLADLPVPEEDDLQVFSDTTTPTPREGADQASGVLSPSQIDSIMKINRSIKAGELTIDAAAELAAQSLGMDASSVRRFLVDHNA